VGRTGAPAESARVGGGVKTRRGSAATKRAAIARRGRRAAGVASRTRAGARVSTDSTPCWYFRTTRGRAAAARASRAPRASRSGAENAEQRSRAGGPRPSRGVTHLQTRGHPSV
jgi:hypothetical protein